MTEINADDVIKSFVERWGELNPDVNHGIEFAVEYFQKQQALPDEELVEEILVEKIFAMAHEFRNNLSFKNRIRKLLQSRQPEIDIKRLAHLLYISIPPSSKDSAKDPPRYGDITKAFEERLRDEFQSRQPEKPRITREEINECVDFWQADHTENIIKLLKSKGIEVEEKP